MCHFTITSRRQVHCFFIVKLLLRLAIGPSWLGHSPQCHPCHHRLLDPAYQHLVRLDYCFQSAHRSWHSRAPIILHDLHRLNGPTTLQGSTTLEVLFFSWQIRFSGQRPVIVVFDAQLCDGMLPTGEGSDATEHELEYPHFRGRVVAELELLWGKRKAQVCRACQASQKRQVDYISYITIHPIRR